jgi:hypothetical protein
VLTRQLIKREGGDVWDERNLIPLCLGCHAAHHSRMGTLPLSALPDGVFAFAQELLGGPAAFEMLRRYYAGRDPRLDALLEDGAA